MNRKNVIALIVLGLGLTTIILGGIYHIVGGGWMLGITATITLWFWGHALSQLKARLTDISEITKISPLKEILLGAVITAIVGGFFWILFGFAPNWVRMIPHTRGASDQVVTWVLVIFGIPLLKPISLLYQDLIPVKSDNFAKAAFWIWIIMIPSLATLSLAGNTNWSEGFDPGNGNAKLIGHELADGSICINDDQTTTGLESGKPGSLTGKFCSRHGDPTSFLTKEQVLKAQKQPLDLGKVDDLADHLAFSSGSQTQKEEWVMTVRWSNGKSITYTTPMPPPAKSPDGQVSMQYVTNTGDKGWIKLDQNGNGTFADSGTGKCSLKLNEQKTCWSGAWTADISSGTAKEGTLVITKQ